MLNIISLTRLPISTFAPTHLKFLLRFQSQLISSSSLVPTYEHVTRLILDQKSSSQALQTFRWASKLPNFTHNKSTYRALIHKLCTFRRFETVKEVLEEMPDSIGSPPDESIFVTIVRGLGRIGMNRQAIKVLDLVARFEQYPSLKILNSILDVLVKEDIDLARKFYRKKMMGCGIHGDDYTFGILMKGLCLTTRLDEGFKLLQFIKSRGVTPKTVIYNTLIYGLCKNGKVGRARSLMNEMVEPNEVTHNILITAYCRDGNLIQALVILEKCFHLFFLPDIVTITKVVELLCSEGLATDALEVLERVEEKGGDVDLVAYNTLIKGLCRLGKPKVGHSFLKKMESKGCLPDVNTYNALISGFFDNGELDSALNLLGEMKIDGINFNFFTYDTLTRGLCSAGRIEDALKFLDLMEESRGGPGDKISPYNSIIYGLYKKNQSEEAVKFLVKMGSFFPRTVDKSLRILGFCEEGATEEAKRIYDEMIKEGSFPSALVYASLVKGLCLDGDVREAFELMNEMIGKEYFPVASTFNALVSGFCKQGKVASASKLMEEMIGRGCLPDVGSYSPMVDALCRIGDFQKAVGLLLQMIERGIVPDFLTWDSLLHCLSQQKIWWESKNMIHVNNFVCWILET